MAKSTTLDDMSVEDLRERAKHEGITGASHMRKSELLDALGGKREKSGKAPSGKTDAVSLLIADHREVKALFKDVLKRKPDDEAVGELAEQIAKALTIHAQVEEDIFYPALKQAAIDDADDDAKQLVLEAYVEHGGVKELIADIQRRTTGDESFHAILQVMSESVEHHVEEEEGEMFKSARKLLGPERLAQLGEQIAAAKTAAG